MRAPTRKPFRPFSRTAPLPDSASHSHAPPPIDPTRVLTRLHALFHSSESSHSEGNGVPGDEDGMLRAKTEPTMRSTSAVDLQDEVDFKQRDAIKVLCVTWNMGDALPKGDLSVLLGSVPHYTPSTPTDQLPQLPMENAHPYHIVVVAGQECPTPSGVPRGLGGVMKGVSVRHKREKEEKEREEKKGKEHLEVVGEEKEKEKEKEKEVSTPTAPRSPFLPASESSEDEAPPLTATRAAAPSSITPHTPQGHKHPAAKGWSTMLDDWFCGPVPQSEHAFGNVPTFPASPSDSPSPSMLSPHPRPPDMLRTNSAPPSASPSSSSNPLAIPIPASSTHRHLPMLARSPLARSRSSEDSSSGSLGLQVPISHQPTAYSSPMGAVVRPEIVIPSGLAETGEDRFHTTRRSDFAGGGCYLHLVKERLMGMYLSVYVYKGCEHLVQGVDKDFVTAGLVRGRLGNKGGIGVSLKLADHTFLFVNSHLAAHTNRLGTRIANVRKIKEELKLDCFLGKDDPRGMAEDITDRFDSVFWMGDLNFRLELSRLHAEWLIEQKNYAEALLWDQLRSIMKDPDPESNPFPGFQEHIIDFAPTFKYDVWRSVKATNREIKRSLKRRGTLDGRVAKPPTAPIPLEHVAEAEDTEDHPIHASVEDATRDSEEDTRVENELSRQSFESSRYTSDARSTAGTEGEEDGSEVLGRSIDYTAYGSRHKAFEVAVKAKTKRFLGLVKMDGILTPHKRADGLGRRPSTRKPAAVKEARDFDEQSRRTSFSSFQSAREEGQAQEAEPRPSFSSSLAPAKPRIEAGRYIPPPANVRRASLSASPRQPLTRGMSVLKRSVSGMSMKEEKEDGDEDGGDGESMADPREGVYDSSKKQRVPSWCDRVLWKTHIVPDAEPRPSPTPSPDPSNHHRISRLPQYFANLRSSVVSRSLSLEPSLTDRRIGQPHPPQHRLASFRDETPPPDPNSRSPVLDETTPALPLMASPEPSPTWASPTAFGLVPGPRRSSPPADLKHSHSHSRQRSGSTPHPLTDPASEQHTLPADPMITFDPAIPFRSERILDGSANRMGRKRANSDSLHLQAKAPAGQKMSDTDAKLATAPPVRQNSAGLLRHQSEALNGHPLEEVKSSYSSYKNREGEHTIDERGGFVRFLKDLPNWLHGRSSGPIAPEMDAETQGAKDGSQMARRRRRNKGEVECLHYGTIDDAGMRQLEGRSDHRPAIFAAAVYI